MRSNFENLRLLVEEHHDLFAALDFGPLCPIPGSQTFQYFLHPDYAEARARQFGLNVNRDYLLSVQDRYRNSDIFDNEDMIQDFLHGCCPDINAMIVDEYMSKISELARQRGIVVGGGV